MKTKHLKKIIKEVVKAALREAKIQDPTKEEMMTYLQQQYGREDGWKDEAEVAIYWFANFYHGGQSSNLYSALSTSPFSPGPIARGPEKDSMESMMYKDLVYQFAGGEGLDDEEEVQEVLSDQPKKFTVRFAVLGRETTEETFNSREEAIKAARDFIKSVVTPGAKKAGERVEGVKNGYIVRQAAGNTVAAAIIQGETMFQENAMNFNVNTFKQLKKEYEKAVKTGQKSFMFNGQEVLVDYAKYLIQYLTPKFGGIKETVEDDEAEYVEYIGPWPGEEPFMLQTPSGVSKFEYCKAKYPSGKTDLGVYSYRGDMCYGYNYFRKAHRLP